MKIGTTYKYVLLVLGLWVLGSCKGQVKEATSDYEYRTGDINGIGKWYMGREIAHVMGFQGMNWLERPEREEEENTSKLLKNMDIQPTDLIADIGAGSGYHVFKMAPKAQQGIVYAVDIPKEMLAASESKQKPKNVPTFKSYREAKGASTFLKMRSIRC